MTTRLISRSLTAVHRFSGILSLIWFSNLSAHCQFSALPPAILYNASPKAISGRTSYIRVRLEFLRYPHLIRRLFNGGRFDPPQSFTSASVWTWIGHPVSGLPHTTKTALLRLALASASTLKTLTLLYTTTRRTILQKVPHHTLTCSGCL